MKKLASVSTALLFSALLIAAPALAQDADSVAVELEQFGLYVDSGLDRNESEISDDVARARNAGFLFYVVLLEDDPAGGATTFADSLLNRLGVGTILVLSASDEGMVSNELTQDEIETALDRGFAGSESGGDEGYVSGVVDSITGTETPTAPVSGSGSGSGLLILVAIVGGLVLLVWLAIRKSKKSSHAANVRAVEEARTEIRSQLDAIANILLEITDLVSASTTSQDDTYLRQASATYTEAEESFGTATDLRALESLSDRLGEARWQLDAAAAIATGKEPPDKPAKEQRYECFFDPTHSNATETAEISTPAGKKTVRVCREDAEKLRRGTQPQPRMIDVEGRRVPAPMAPRSHGGGGFSWLDTFSILAGGAGQAASYDWGGSRRTAARSSSTSQTPTPQPTRRRSTTSSGTRSRAGRDRRRKR
ncbi:MAG: DUF6676 family protein [Acidimicrobiia bacterium]